MKRLIVTVQGCVQGVGFRPFVYRLARGYRLAGTIKNTASGVEIDIQGTPQALEAFLQDLKSKKPERASIAAIGASEAPLHTTTAFEIVPSSRSEETALPLLPDTAICQECLQELNDPRNRRYRYPFLHCIGCGPRFSLFTSMPFDRANTTMSAFEMCDACRKEYEDPADRRFHSQTNCCMACGPELALKDPEGRLLARQNLAVEAAVDLLREGKILAFKNTGGYQLLIDATNAEAVATLRLRKQRAAKPFALLAPSLDFVNAIADVGPAEEEVLTSQAAPIVLLKKKRDERIIAPNVACGTPYFGIMLPHTPLQYLLMALFGKPLVATSGNISGRPLCISEQEAFSQLRQVADAFLVHNRPIMHRLDDSIVNTVAGEPMMMRRARGYIPYALELPEWIGPSPDWVFAAGSELKNTFAFAKRRTLYISQHIGNLDAASVSAAYDQEVEQWENLLMAKPVKGFGDRHPDYYTTRYLHKRELPMEAIQHHEAHAWAGMVDCGLQPPFLSIVWDGTGYGDDRTVWGGEAFLFDEGGARRVASLYPFRLPGGEKAIREPRRSALGALHALACAGESPYSQWLERVFHKEELSVLASALHKGINAPLCSSVGRLFDVVSALLGCCLVSQYEGHAAMALEAIAQEGSPSSLDYETLLLRKENSLWLDWRPMVKQIFKDCMQGKPAADIAYGFHAALAQSIVELALASGQAKVLLTGGVMQNKLLAETAIAKLTAAGCEACWHSRIPPNDGGLSIGQAACSLWKKRRY